MGLLEFNVLRPEALSKPPFSPFRFCSSNKSHVLAILRANYFPLLGLDSTLFFFSFSHVDPFKT